MRAKGIDISHWQGSFDNMGNIDFVIIKATEGWGWVDPEYENFLREAQTVPIMGAYHYFRTDFEAIDQAEHFYNVTKNKGFHFLAVDYEKTSNNLDEDAEGEFRKFWLHLENLVKSDNKPILLYTSPYIYRDNLCTYSTHWLNVPLWMAHYNYQESQTGSPNVFDASGWVFWQWTDQYNGKLYGVGSVNVDQNVYNGTVKQLHEWLKPQGDNDMDNKWYSSKTFWFSILFGLVSIAGSFGYGDFVPSPELVQYVGIGVSVIGAIVGVVVKYFENKS